MNSPRPRPVKMIGFCKSLFAAGAILATAATSSASTLLTYWDFNNDYAKYSNPNLGSFATSAGGGSSYSNGEVYNSTAKRLSSNAGGYVGGPVFTNGYIDFSGAKGNFNSGSVNSTGWGVFNDSGVNAVATDLSPKQGSLLLVNDLKTSANNPTIIFSLSSAGYADLTFGFAARKASGVTATLGLAWQYSLDGSNWTTLVPSTSLPSGSTGGGTFVAYSFTLPTELNNLSNFQLKLALDFTGAGTGTSFGIDNIQLNAASTVPEPGTVMLFGLGGAVLVFRAFRRRSS